jgi:hypothetical protein
VTDAALPLFSATQVDTQDDCARKWGFYKIEGIKGVQNRFAARGEELHKIAEGFLLDGKAPPETDAGKVFKAGLRHLPAPGTCLAVEEKFLWYPKGEAFGFSGRKDWLESISVEPCIGPTDIVDHLIRVGDHKTTTSENWIKPVEALRVHPQPLIYGANVLVEYDWLPTVDFRWLYYIWEPRRPHAVPRDWQMSAPEIEDGFGKIVEKCRRMATWLKQGVRANELPYDVDACDKYGGCPYREHCGLTPQERLRGIMAQLSLKEKLMARKSTPEQAPVAAAPAAAPAAQTVAASAAVGKPAPAETKKAGGGSLLDRMKGHMTGKATATPAAAAPAAQAPSAPAPAPDKAISPAKAATVTIDNTEALAIACQQIADGFAAISNHFKGQLAKKN